MHHIAVLHDVLLAFQAPFAHVFGALFTLVLDEVGIGNHFGADKAFLEIGMDHGGCFRCSSADLDRPRAYFLYAGGEIGLQPQQFVAGADHAIKAWFAHAEILQEGQFVVGSQFGDLGFQFVANNDHHRALGLGYGVYLVEIGIVTESLLVDVGDVHGWLRSQQVELLDRGLLILVEVEAAHWIALIYMGAHLGQYVAHLDGILVLASGSFGSAVETFFHSFKIGQCQFGVDNIDVVLRVDRVGNVDDIVIDEAAHHMGDGVAFTDVGEEFVAKAFALGSAGDEAGNVDEFNCCGHHFFRFDDFRQCIESQIRYRHDAGVWLDSAERKVLGRNTGLRQRIEQGGFADVGQPNDAALDTHNYCPVRLLMPIPYANTNAGLARRSLRRRPGM